jgi:riboflavin synthase
MFTGIIEHLGAIASLDIHHRGGHLAIEAPTVVNSIRVSNSIAVNGCCLTIVSVNGGRFSADLSHETLQKTTFGAAQAGLHEGAIVNLEQPLTAGKEFGGHFVLGHVDTVGRVAHLTPDGEGWRFGVEVPEDFARYIVPKGSITIDGISLTIANWHNPSAEIAVIPYTYDHTNIRHLRPGDAVNLEADILAKNIQLHIERYLEARSSKPPSHLTIPELIEQGF